MRSAAMSARVAVDGSVAWRSIVAKLELLHGVRSRRSEMSSVWCLSFLKIVCGLMLWCSSRCRLQKDSVIASRRDQNNEHTI
jgi:hypothetical protein